MRKGWQIKKLGDLFDITSSKRVFKSEWKNRGVPFYRAREIVRLAKHGFVDNDLFISDEMYNDYAKRYGIPKEGDLMVTGVGTLGICYLVRRDDKFYFKDGNIIWLKKKSDIDSRFVQYAFESPFLKEYIGNSAGATVGTYTITKAKETRIPVPPFPEQKRIVAILDEAFAGLETAVANTEKNLANARELFDSYLNSVFTQQVADWGRKKLEDLCERITKGSSPKWQGIEYVDEPGILFVTSENVGLNRMVFRKIKYVEEAFNKKDAKSVLKKGDVLTNIVGASIGRTAIFDRSELANINQAVCLLRCNPEKLNNRFLSYLLNSPFFRKILHDNEINNARANLSLGFFKSLQIPLPHVATQEDIVSSIDTLKIETQNLESIYQQKLAALTELKQSLLQKAFSGELTANPEATIKEVAS